MSTTDLHTSFVEGCRRMHQAKKLLRAGGTVADMAILRRAFADHMVAHSALRDGEELLRFPAQWVDTTGDAE